MIVPSMAFTIGELVLTMQAYFIRDWFTLQVLIFRESLMFTILFKIFDEMKIKRNFLKIINLYRLLLMLQCWYCLDCISWYQNLQDGFQLKDGFLRQKGDYFKEQRSTNVLQYQKNYLKEQSLRQKIPNRYRSIIFRSYLSYIITIEQMKSCSGKYSDNR